MHRLRPHAHIGVRAAVSRDFVMGWAVGNLSWGNGEVSRGVAGYSAPDYVCPGYSYKGWGELAALLVSIAPGRLRKCLRATGGSEAVDIALQAAMIHTGRRKIVSIEDSYHGNCFGHHVGPPLNDAALEKFERRLKHRDVAAVIMEPISLNLGVLIPSARFMPGLQRLCRKYGTLLILDEVASGFGRTGTLFACEQLDVEPDPLCVAKAITGGASGLGAVIATAPIARSMEENGTFYSTYGWHPPSVAAAIATIRFIIRHKTRLLRHVAEMSDLFRVRLSQLMLKGATDIRIRGLAIGIELRSEAYAEKVQKSCRKNGLLVSTEGKTLLLLPALNIDRATASRGLDVLQASFE